MSKRASIALSVLLLAGCFDSKVPSIGGDPQIKVLPATELPPPGRTDLAADERPYLVGPFDKLTIDVFGIDELSKRQVTVDASGRMSFPLVGVVPVAGKTPGEIEDTLRERLAANYIRNPQVTVNLVETVSQVVTVEGEVKLPGLYPVVGRMTLLRAVARAQGTDEFTKLNEVVIFRTVNGQKLAALYNLKAIRLGREEDPEVFANDVIDVGESRARRIFKDAVTILPSIVTPIIVAIQYL